ncbi:MAG: Putative phosphinothricin acetyltransferase YwnH [Cellvibrionales bacterium UBA7375]|nr:MAG: Putative phosphinothricin acetyltransferase YwnH [Cellvibrionales bacterium UBA7375]
MKTKIALRDAVLADADWTIDLRNNDESMHFSSTDCMVTRDEHNQWFSEFLAKQECAIYIAETANQYIGVARFEIRHDNVAIISIDVASEFRNKGFGLSLLNKALEKHHGSSCCNKYLAYIYPFNKRSIKLFEKVGFALVNDKKIPHEYAKVMSTP